MSGHPSTLGVVRHVAIAAGLCAFFGFTLGCLGPTLDDLDEARATQAAVADAEAAARREAREAAVIEAICGPNASAMRLANQSIRCVNKHGLKSRLTARVQL